MEAPSILRSLDPYHQRIGYLGALTTVANRGLDTSSALSNRLSDLLFREVRPGDPTYAHLMRRIGEQRRRDLDKLMALHPKTKVPSIFASEDSQSWYYLSGMWLYDDAMPSAIGFVQREKVKRVIDLAKWCGLVRQTFELSETGYVIQILLEEKRRGAEVPEALNLIDATCRMGVTLSYLQILLQAESLWPFLICELVDRDEAGEELATRGKFALLKCAVDRMLESIGEPSSPDEVLPLKDVLDFREAIAGKDSTGENYLRPRLEILVDLGLLQKTSGQEKKRGFTYVVTSATRILAGELRQFTNPDTSCSMQQFVDTKFFASMARVYEKNVRSSRGFEENLLLFTRAYERVGREFGLTPGSTVANLACLLAWEQGIVVEVSDLFDSVYAAKKSSWNEFLQMSGGSRFDREFVIRVRKGLVEQLEAKLRN